MARMLSLRVLALAFCTTMLASCGGLFTGSTSSRPSASGTLIFTINWPEPARLIPLAAQSIKIILTADEHVLAQQTVPRPPAGQNSSTVTFPDLPPTQLTATATAYPNSDGTGTPQATGSVVVTITAGQTVHASLTMASTITTVNVSPNPSQVEVGQTVQLTATAKDAEGNIVLVPVTNPFTWAVVSGAEYASVDGNGLVAGLAEGTATVQATEKESGVSGEAQALTGPAAPVVATVEVSPNPARTAVGQSLQLTATAKDIFGDIILLPSANFTWEVTSGASFASVSPSGLVTGLAEGTATVRATERESGVSGEAQVIVGTAPPEPGNPIWVYETDFSPSSVSVSRDGSYIAVGSSGKVYFLDRDGSLLWNYPTDFPIVDISMTADLSQIAAGGSEGIVIPDGVVYFLNQQGELLGTINPNGVSSVSLSPDGKYFAMTYVHGLGWNDVVALWGDDEGEWLWSYNFGRDQTAAVSVSANSEYIAVGGAKDVFGTSGGLRLYDKAGNLLWEHEIDTTMLGGNKYSVSISSDGKYVAAGNRGNNNLYFFDRDQGLVWSYNMGAVNGVSVSGDGAYIAAVTSNAMYLFDVSMNLEWTSEIDNLEDVAISADGTTIVTVANDNKVYAFAAPTATAALSSR